MDHLRDRKTASSPCGGVMEGSDVVSVWGKRETQSAAATTQSPLVVNELCSGGMLRLGESVAGLIAPRYSSPSLILPRFLETYETGQISFSSFDHEIEIFSTINIGRRRVTKGWTS